MKATVGRKLVMGIISLFLSGTCAAFEQIDVVVIGGTVAGIEAAVAAKNAGARVVLFEARHALGCDLAEKLLLNLGDVDGAAKKTLEAYAKDPRRAYAAHAQLVLRKDK